MGWDHKGIIWIFHQGDHTAAHLAKPFETSEHDAFTGGRGGGASRAACCAEPERGLYTPPNLGI